MYTLRVVKQERENSESNFNQTTENFELGDAYIKLEKGLSEKFDMYVNKEVIGEEKYNSISAIVIGTSNHIYTIVESTDDAIYTYYIMTESGKTFEKL